MFNILVVEDKKNSLSKGTSSKSSSATGTNSSKTSGTVDSGKI
jgi:hypothetical protein